MAPYQKGAAKRILEQEKGRPDPTVATGSVDRTESPTQPPLEPASRGEDREGEHLYSQLPYAPTGTPNGGKVPEGATPGQGDPGCHPQEGGHQRPRLWKYPGQAEPQQREPGEKQKNKQYQKHPRGPPSRHPRNTVNLQCFSRKGGQGGSQKGRETCKMNCKNTRDGRAGQNKTDKYNPTPLGSFPPLPRNSNGALKERSRRLCFTGEACPHPGATIIREDKEKGVLGNKQNCLIDP